MQKGLDSAMDDWHQSDPWQRWSLCVYTPVHNPCIQDPYRLIRSEALTLWHRWIAFLLSISEQGVSDSLKPGMRLMTLTFILWCKKNRKRGKKRCIFQNIGLVTEGIREHPWIVWICRRDDQKTMLKILKTRYLCECFIHLLKFPGSRLDLYSKSFFF